MTYLNRDLCVGDVTCFTSDVLEQTYLCCYLLECVKDVTCFIIDLPEQTYLCCYLLECVGDVTCFSRPTCAVIYLSV